MNSDDIEAKNFQKNDKSNRKILIVVFVIISCIVTFCLILLIGGFGVSKLDLFVKETPNPELLLVGSSWQTLETGNLFESRITLNFRSDGKYIATAISDVAEGYYQIQSTEVIDEDSAVFHLAVTIEEGGRSRDFYPTITIHGDEMIFEIEGRTEEAVRIK